MTEVTILSIFDRKAMFVGIVAVKLIDMFDREIASFSNTNEESISFVDVREVDAGGVFVIRVVMLNKVEHIISPETTAFLTDEAPIRPSKAKM